MPYFFEPFGAHGIDAAPAFSVNDRREIFIGLPSGLMQQITYKVARDLLNWTHAILRDEWLPLADCGPELEVEFLIASRQDGDISLEAFWTPARKGKSPSDSAENGDISLEAYRATRRKGKSLIGWRLTVPEIENKRGVLRFDLDRKALADFHAVLLEGLTALAMTDYLLLSDLNKTVNDVEISLIAEFLSDDLVKRKMAKVSEAMKDHRGPGAPIGAASRKGKGVKPMKMAGLPAKTCLEENDHG